MVTNGLSGRNIGRPRQFEDSEAFAAVARLLESSGFHNLTLARVAQSLGCTSQALIRRFGSRQGLERAFLAWMTDRAAARFEAVRLQYASPLEAFRIGYCLPETHAPTGPAGYAHLLAFQIEAGLDPDLHDEITRRKALYLQNLTKSVEAAVAANELAGCDAETVAFLLLVAGSGALLQWIADPEGDLPDQIARVFDAVIGPYRVQE